MHIVDFIKENWEKLLAGMSPEKREQYGLVLHRLIESLLGLKTRAQDLVKAETRMTNFDENNDNLNEAQIDYVNKVESYHQQVYATISSAILAANHFGIYGVKTSHPIRSVEKFLDYLINDFPTGNRTHDNYLRSVAVTLKSSISFRAKYVDHPQQHPAQHWMTYNYAGKVCVIYYIPGSNNFITHNSSIDPYDPKFAPPISCESFIVSPREDLIQQAVVDLVSFILYRE